MSEDKKPREWILKWYWENNVICWAKTAHVAGPWPDFQEHDKTEEIRVIEKSAYDDACKEIFRLEAKRQLLEKKLAVAVEALKRITAKSEKRIWSDKGHECESKKGLEGAHSTATVALEKIGKLK